MVWEERFYKLIIACDTKWIYKYIKHDREVEQFDTIAGQKIMSNVI